MILAREEKATTVLTDSLGPVLVLQTLQQVVEALVIPLAELLLCNGHQLLRIQTALLALVGEVASHRHDLLLCQRPVHLHVHKNTTLGHLYLQAHPQVHTNTMLGHLDLQVHLHVHTNTTIGLLNLQVHLYVPVYIYNPWSP